MTLDPKLVNLACEGLVSFRIEGRLFAIPIGLVREINRHLELTRVHRAPTSMRGLVNLRGQIVTVMDFGECLGFGLREISNTSRLVVLNESVDLPIELPDGVGTDDATIGLLVDKISDVLTPKPYELELPPAHLDRNERAFLIAVCKTEHHTVGILNPAALVEATATETNHLLESLTGTKPGLGSLEGKINAQTH